MKPGARITYVDGSGRGWEAVVVTVTGSGPSGYKTVSLSADGTLHEGVPHEGDSKGRGHWTFTPVSEVAPKRRKK